MVQHMKSAFDHGYYFLLTIGTGHCIHYIYTDDSHTNSVFLVRMELRWQTNLLLERAHIELATRIIC